MRKISVGLVLRTSAICCSAILCLGGSLCASVITYNTNGSSTGFGGTSLTLANSSGDSAALTFIPDIGITTAVPSNINYGNFTLTCPSCSTQALSIGTFSGTYFSPFTFNLVITDSSDGAAGKFVGTSTGGTVYSDASNLTINWAPLQIGPGTLNATSGSFGGTKFSTTVFTGIVAPNSGAVPGQSTVQGYVSFTSTPEPATLFTTVIALLSFGIVSRKRYLARLLH